MRIMSFLNANRDLIFSAAIGVLLFKVLELVLKAIGKTDFWRKVLVAFKRKPALVALIVLLAAFVFYSFYLTNVSHTTTRINKQPMGLLGFATMLVSVLAMVCFNNAYPRRKNTNYTMLFLALAMHILIIWFDGAYIGKIIEALNDPVSQLDVTKETYILVTMDMLSIHRVIVGIGALLTVLVPVYGKILRKINTNVKIEGNSDMAAIEIEGND